MEHLWHPHSGIATVTVMLEGWSAISPRPTGKRGVLPTGSIEWMRAGNGVWHTGQAEPGHVKVFQLWVALPPELENGPNASHYVDARRGTRSRVRRGSSSATYGGVEEPDRAPPMTYLR